jgi:hypothetical protein
MSGIFEFGEKIEGYEVRVLNERAVRAGAGLLFFFAIIAFMNAWLLGNFQPTRVFVVAFLFDFSLRIFINPRYAPSLIVGQWVVRKQQPEYVGAPQKRFAWAIGLVLALTMLYLVVLNNVIGPVNLIVCSACLVLMFFESAFGICLGCKLYNLFNKEKARLCPGNTCDTEAAKSADNSMVQIVIVLVFALVVGAVSQWVYTTGTKSLQHNRSFAAPAPVAPVDPAEAERCKVPDYAKAMGHEEKWKLHNNCK